MFLLEWLMRLLYGKEGADEIMTQPVPRASPKRVKPRKTRRK